MIAVFCSPMFTPISLAGAPGEEPLPPPLVVDMMLEESMFRRMSVREFTNETISDEELSTILWAACGFQSDGDRTITGINNTYSGIIYVLKEDAAYTYNPMNHSLVFFKDGDWRDIVGWQYKAPIQLGLCYNTDKADSKFGGAELGQMGQNIQFMANALNLGTVVCGQTPPAIEPLGIPDNEEGIIVMPLGHPIYPYNFKNRPFWFSPYPRLRTSSLSLSEALDTQAEATSFNGTLTRSEDGQFLWCTYGFSPYIDRSGQEKNSIKRHRSVPSAHGYYPLRMYAATEKGIYFYQPNLLVQFGNFPIDFLGMPVITYLAKKISGDHRQEIANASTQPSIASAPLIILTFLDVNKTRPAGADDLSAEQYRRFWYFEAGAAAHNVLLEATAWNLSAAIVLPADIVSLQSILSVNKDSVPLFIIPVGR
jgi:nitroreductase